MTDDKNTPEAPAPVSPAPSGNGKSGSNKTITIVVVVIAILAVGGWLAQGYFARIAAKNTTESIIGGLTGSDVELDSEGNVAKVTTDDGSFEMNQTAKWPSDMPAEVPEFTAGVIESSAKSTATGSAGWTISFKSVQTGAYSSYREQLLAKGWNETGTYESDAKMTNMENDKYYLIFTTEETDFTGSLMVSTKQ